MVRPFQDTSLKIIDPSLIEKIAEDLRNQGLKIVTLNGSFDLLHAGHLYIISEAKKQGDVLIMAINSDASIRQYKSPNRPIIALKYRLAMIAALEYVDYVTWFDELDPRVILTKIKPHIHVNGAEYGAHCIEEETVLAGGGKIHLVERIDGLATSEIINKIHSL